MDVVELELLWSNLRSVVTEQAKAMQRTAFSPVVREAGDLAYAIFDRRGRMVAQAETGTPGHINCLAFCGGFLVNMFEGRLQPGDVLVTNDPWHGAGHTFDITVFAPIFRNGKILCYLGSTNHHTDIGGLGVSISSTDVHEEGLWIPPLKLYEAGKPNETLYALIRRNVRTPDLISGDLAAQVASAQRGGEAVIDMCERFGIEDIEDLSDAIIARSEKAMRDAIRTCKPGSFSGETRFDITDSLTITLKSTVHIDNEKGEVLIDFAGSSPQVRHGINVVLNYTHAYSTFAVRSCLSPEIPNNHGSLLPIKVTAPEGTVVNCRYPAPVAARHMVGMYVPMPVLKALAQVVPERVLAEGPGAPWTAQVVGERDDGLPFVSTQFSFAGGMGARYGKPGPAATAYPTGVGATPLEVIEADSPVVFRRREIMPGTGGRGRNHGGDGQIVAFQVRTSKPWMLNASPAGMKYAPEGLAGGQAGELGHFSINGQVRHAGGKSMLNPDDVVTLQTPGGAGYGAE